MGVFAPSLQIVQKSGEGLLLQEKRSGLCLSFPSHCKGNSWWEGTHRAVLGRREAVTPHPPPREMAERPGRAVCSSWQVAVFIAWDPAICKEGNWPQAAGKKKKFPRNFQRFSHPGKKWKQRMCALRLLQPLALP